MSEVKCVVTYPVEIDEISVTKIDGVTVEGQFEEGKLVLKRDDTDIADGLNVTIVLHGTVSLKVVMDVFIDGEQFNKKPIEAIYMQGGHYVINYNA